MVVLDWSGMDEIMLYRIGLNTSMDWGGFAGWIGLGVIGLNVRLDLFDYVDRTRFG